MRTGGHRTLGFRTMSAQGHGNRAGRRGRRHMQRKRSSKDMYEQQNELWDDLNKTAAKIEVKDQNEAKSKKRKSKDMYEQQNELWQNLMNQNDDVIKETSPVIETNNKSK